MSTRLTLVAALLAVGSLATACSDAPPYATLEGDVYLTPGFGRVVNAAGTRVSLIPDTLELDSMLARLCVARDEQVARHAASLEAATQRAWARRERILTAQVGRTVMADSSSHFVLDTVAPGRYRLWARIRGASGPITWLVPLRVRRGDSVRINLDSGNTDDNPFKCHW